MKRFTRIIITLLALVSITLLAACQDPVGTLLGGRPSDVEASQGDYADRIVVTWTGVADEQSGEDTIRVSGYRISREEGVSGIELPQGDVAATSNSYSDTLIERGRSYTYRVSARYENGDTSIQSKPATGYALMTTLLSVYAESTRSKGARPFDTTTTTAGGEAWFDFAGQAGWVYRVEPLDSSGNPSVVTRASLFMKGNIEHALPDIPAEDGSYYFRLPATGFFHVRLEDGTGTVSVSHQ